MGISIKNPVAERKLRRVSRLLGKNMTATVIELADAKLKELDGPRNRARRLRRIDEIVRHAKTLPVLSTASEDEILGYDKMIK